MTLLLILVIAVLVLFLAGGFIVGLTLTLLWWALTGLLVGAVARLVLPGAQGLGILTTILFGIGGSLLGGIVADALGWGWLLQFLLAVAAAAVLISLFSSAAPRRSARI